ncbi:MAG: radical SAM protein [Clostridia bacterium]|nr:radical SAM protein [Clostridia bacterium]
MLDLKKCELCPRRCGADRRKESGLCGQKETIKIARAALHFWEEPPISGERGSGTIFFSGCSLGCIYCQNRAISHRGKGKEISLERLIALFFDLEKQGAHNINLVTPTHYALQIKEAVAGYRAQGGKLPILYNTSGYERIETLQALKETVDIYLTDLKYRESASAQKYSRAADYPAVARAALSEMVSLVGAPRLDERGMLKRGVVVRLLVLPSLEHEAMMNLKWLKETFGDTIMVSIMNQYTPVGDGLPKELSAPLPPAAYRTVVDYARSLQFKYAYIQEGETAKESFIPDFEEETF